MKGEIPDEYRLEVGDRVYDLRVCNILIRPVLCTHPRFRPENDRPMSKDWVCPDCKKKLDVDKLRGRPCS